MALKKDALDEILKMQKTCDKIYKEFIKLNNQRVEEKQKLN